LSRICRSASTGRIPRGCGSSSRAQEKIIKFNELLANCLIFHTAVDITKVVNDLIDEGWQIDPVDLATITPYITSKTRRFGTWHLGMEPLDGQAVGHLRLVA